MKKVTEAMLNGLLSRRDGRWKGASPIKATWKRLEDEGYVVKGADGRPAVTPKGYQALAEAGL